MRRDPRVTERALLEIASGQGGCFTAAQALSVGYAYPQQIYHKNRGNWLVIDRAIYRLRDYLEWGREDLIRWSFWSQNRHGEIQAVASHDTAVSFHELGDANPARIHLTVPPGFRKKPPDEGCLLHYARLQPHEWEERPGFRVTTPLRTLIDLAMIPFSQDLLESAVDDALRNKMVRRADLASTGLPEKARERFQKILEWMERPEATNDRLAAVEKPSEPFLFREPRQLKMYERLNRLVGPGPAEFYYDACRLMSLTPPMQATTHLVAHLIREIESALRAILETVKEPNRQNAGESDKKGEKHAEAIKGTGGNLHLHPQIIKAWVDMSGENNPDSLASRAHRRYLDTPRPQDENFRKFWNDIQDILTHVLDKIEENYLEVLRLLDNLINQAVPTADSIKSLRNNVPCNLITYGYFFGKVDNPVWIKLLSDGGFYRSPQWPQSEYLARMASRDPQTVLDVMLQIPETDNIRVHDNLADAALAMPAGLAAKWVEKEIAWLKKQDRLYFLLPEILGKLIGHLAKGEEIDIAFELAKALLRILPDPKAETIRREKKLWERLKPRPLFEVWSYGNVIKQDIPELTVKDALGAVKMLCELLNDAIKFSRSDENAMSVYDGSSIWRPTIERSEAHGFEDLAVRDMLVTAIRDISEKIVKSSPEMAGGLFHLLEGNTWDVYGRIVMHLLRVMAPPPPKYLKKYLVDQQRLDEFDHEYVVLSKERFESLSEEDRGTIFQWIEQGPPKEPLRDATEDEKKIAVERWKWRRLTALRNHLSPPTRSIYDPLAKKYGVPEHPEETGKVRSWIGPESPKSAQEMQTMGVDGVLKLLREWQPSNDHMSPSIEGLGRELAKVVESQPEEYARQAEAFKGIDPTYIRALLSGWENAVKQKRIFSWKPVLELCKAVVANPWAIPERMSDDKWDADQNWSPSRKVMADMLSIGLSDDNAEHVTHEFGETVWQIIESLTGDEDPTLEDESSKWATARDPATIALNTVRGSAMHATIRYALWIRRRLEKETDAPERLKKGFDNMPEVRKVLEERLDDQSVGVRAVYGQWFPWIVLIDGEWARKHACRIFPPDNPQLRDAAWETYVVFCEPYTNVFNILRAEYKNAIERLEEHKAKDARFLPDCDEQLAEHLINYYARGKLDFGDTDGLLDLFYGKASDNLRRKALMALGGILRVNPNLPIDVLERMKRLWECRLKSVQATKVTGQASTETAAFGLWFVSGKFPDEWALEQLIEAVKIAGTVDAEMDVVKKLAETVKTMPRQTIECLRILVESCTESYHLHIWGEDIRSILSSAMAMAGEARESAIDLIHRLGALGFLEYRDFLPNGDGR